MHRTRLKAVFFGTSGSWVLLKAMLGMRRFLALSVFFLITAGEASKP